MSTDKWSEFSWKKRPTVRPATVRLIQGEYVDTAKLDILAEDEFVIFGRYFHRWGRMQHYVYVKAAKVWRIPQGDELAMLHHWYMTKPADEPERCPHCHRPVES